MRPRIQRIYDHMSRPDYLDRDGVVHVDDLIGVPFKTRGVDPKTGFDCWGLVKYVYQRFGVTLPSYKHRGCEPLHAAMSINGALVLGCWELVENPVDEDVPLVVLIRNHPVVVNHLGVYMGQGRVLHCMKETGTVLESIDPGLRPRIAGFYAWAGIGSAEDFEHQARYAENMKRLDDNRHDKVYKCINRLVAEELCSQSQTD